MDKITATKEARIGALYQGGDWYVTRWKRGCYKALPHDRYRGSIDGRIVDTFTPERVRRTVPPSVAKCGVCGDPATHVNRKNGAADLCHSCYLLERRQVAGQRKRSDRKSKKG